MWWMFVPVYWVWSWIVTPFVWAVYIPIWIMKTIYRTCSRTTKYEVHVYHHFDDDARPFQTNGVGKRN